MTSQPLRITLFAFLLVKCEANEPNFEFDRFFADPVRVTSNGPETIAEIVQCHKILRDQASQVFTSRDRDRDLNPSLGLK